MKCPHCGFVSFEYLEDCKKCSKSLAAHKSHFGINFLEPVGLGVLSFVGSSASDLADAASSLGTDDFTVDTSASDSAVYEDEPQALSGDDSIIIGEDDEDVQVAVDFEDEEDEEVEVSLAEEDDSISIDTDSISLDLDEIAEEEEIPVSEVEEPEDDSISIDTDSISLDLDEITEEEEIPVSEVEEPEDESVSDATMDSDSEFSIDIDDDLVDGAALEESTEIDQMDLQQELEQAADVGEPEDPDTLIIQDAPEIPGDEQEIEVETLSDSITGDDMDLEDIAEVGDVDEIAVEDEIEDDEIEVSVSDEIEIEDIDDTEIADSDLAATLTTDELNMSSLMDVDGGDFSNIELSLDDETIFSGGADDVDDQSLDESLDLDLDLDLSDLNLGIGDDDLDFDGE